MIGESRNNLQSAPEESNTYSFDEFALRNQIEASSNGMLHRLFNEIDIDLIERLIRREKAHEGRPVILGEISTSVHCKGSSPRVLDWWMLWAASSPRTRLPFVWHFWDSWCADFYFLSVAFPKIKQSSLSTRRDTRMAFDPNAGSRFSCLSWFIPQCKFGE